MVGISGEAAPLEQATVKEGHVAATISGPARGKIGPILFTFKGVLSTKDLANNAPRSYWNKTANGWPDEVTLRMWGDLMIAEKKARKLAKMLIFVDNAALHCDLELCANLAANNITLFGLIPSATSKQQPLDKAFFGSIKAKIPGIAARLGLVRSYATIAQIFEVAVKEMEDTASRKGMSALSHGFRATGIYPWNPAVHTDKSFAPSDARLGIKKGDASIKAAAELGKAAAQSIIAAAVFATSPEGSKKLDELAAKKRAARLALAAGTGKTPEGDIDEFGTVHRPLYTSTIFHEQVAAKAAAAAAADKNAKAKAAQRAAAAAAKKADKEQRSAAFKAKVAARKAQHAAKEADKAAREHARAAKPKVAAPKRRIDEEEAHDAYAKGYVKRMRTK